VKTVRSLSVLVAAALLLIPVAGRGQVPSPTGNLYGTALDPQGNAVGGVTATLTGPGAAHTAVSDATGDFRFLGLSPGEYSLTLERPGFATAQRSVTVALGNVVLSVPLLIAGVKEGVTVEGGAPGLDSREVQTGATFGRRELDSIPTTRDPWGLLQQVPGVLLVNVNTGGSPGSQQVPFVGKGSPGGQNSYNLDGAAISIGGVSPMFFDFDSLDTIEVTTGGSDLSLASPGVALNLVTRRGTNELRASARGYYTGGAGWDYGVEAGGPLWRDRVWLWGAFAHNDYLGHPFFNFAGEPLENRERLEHWNAKLDARPVPANSLTFAYTHFERTVLGWATGPDKSPESSLTNVHPGQSYRVGDSHVFSARLFGSAYFTYVPASSTDLPVGGLDEQSDLDASGIWQHSLLTRRIRDDKHQTGLNLSTFFDTGVLRHEVKLGLGYWHVRFDQIREWPGDELVGLARALDAGPDETGVVSITRRQNAKSEVDLYDVYAGDTIQAGRLTVSVGGRFDFQQGRNFASTVPANPVFPDLLPAVAYPGDAGYSMTWRTFQPRVSAAYSLSEGRTLLRASYSRFADQMDSTTVFATNHFPDITGLNYRWTDANGDGRVQSGEVDTSEHGNLGAFGVDPKDPGSIVPVDQISPDLRPPTTDEFIVGIERQFSPGLSGSLAYTHRTRRRLTFSPLVGTTRESWQYFGQATGTATDGSFALSFDEPFYGLIDCPDPCSGVVLENRPDASETYDGVELQVMKSFSSGWMARVSFAWNDARQQIGPGAISDPNNETPGTNASGPTLNGGQINARWQFNVSAAFPLPWGIAGGVNLFGREGFPAVYSVFVATGPEDSVYHESLLQIGPATRFRTPNVFTADLQLSRTLRLGGVDITPTFDCFNLFNSRTILGRGGIVGSYDSSAGFEQLDGFNTPYDILAPRVYRGGVRISF